MLDRPPGRDRLCVIHGHARSVLAPPGRRSSHGGARNQPSWGRAGAGASRCQVEDGDPHNCRRRLAGRPGRAHGGCSHAPGGTAGRRARLPYLDFGSYAGYGIPFNTVPGTQPKLRVRFGYAAESDPGPYPIPSKPKIEASSDHHMLIVDRDHCKLYELWNARHTSTGWRAGSGAIWALGSNALRPDGWTSADAAGLPVLPGRVRYREVATGVFDRALQFTAA